jgi:hypothetical protein
MNKKNLRLAKNICWVVAGISMFFLILGNTKNNPLSVTAFIFIVTGIMFNYLEDKK